MSRRLKVNLRVTRAAHLLMSATRLSSSEPWAAQFPPWSPMRPSMPSVARLSAISFHMSPEWPCTLSYSRVEWSIFWRFSQERFALAAPTALTPPVVNPRAHSRAYVLSGLITTCEARLSVSIWRMPHSQLSVIPASSAVLLVTRVAPRKRGSSWSKITGPDPLARTSTRVWPSWAVATNPNPPRSSWLFVAFWWPPSQEMWIEVGRGRKISLRMGWL